MTSLGALFCLAYAMASINGRRAVLLVLAASIGFNDSAALVIGGFAITPYYLGLLLFLAMSFLGRSSRTETNKPRIAGRLLMSLVIYSAVVTLFAPSLFRGLGVISSSLGLDEQVGALSALGPSSSNVAQMAYLVLNALLLWTVANSGQLNNRVIGSGFAIGSAVASLAYIFQQSGAPWPSAFFDNSPRGFYASGPDRLRGQFSEPSHLGAFALAASSYFLVRLLQAKSPLEVLARVALLGLSAVPFVASASGTGLAGAAIGGAIIITVGIVKAIAVLPTLHIPVPAALLGLSGLVVLAFGTPALISAAQSIVQAKQGTTSQINRAYSNANGIDVLFSTYGFGAGLGSNRTSSLVALLLSQIGMVGLGLFLALVLVLISRSLTMRPTNIAPAVALVAFLASASVSLADFSSPLLWILLGALISTRLSAPAKVGRQIESSDHRLFVR